MITHPQRSKDIPCRKGCSVLLNAYRLSDTLRYLCIPIHLQNSQYTEVSRYTDDTVCSCSIGWTMYYWRHLFQWHRCTCVGDLALRRVTELSAESVILMGTRAKWCLVNLKPIYNALGPDKTSSFTRVLCTNRCKHNWTQETGKTKTYILQDVPDTYFGCNVLWLF